MPNYFDIEKLEALIPSTWLLGALDDDANGTELLPTLREYLVSGLNATAAAKQLFIHRNTFYQRLDKIQQLITSDLENPDTRLFMLMSYRFVDLLKLDPVPKK